MLRPFPILIPAGVGNSPGLMTVEGNYLFIASASAAFVLKIDGQSEINPAEQGYALKQDFRQLEFINLTAAAVTVLIYVGVGSVLQDFRPINRPLIPSRAQNLFNGVVDGTGVPAASTVLCAADVDRIEVIVQAYAANVGIVVLRSAEFSRIVELSPSEKFRFQYRSGLTAGAFAAGQGVYLSETKY